VSRRYLPVRTTRSFETTWSLVELDARFSTTQWIVGLSMVLMGVVIFWSTRSIFSELNRYFASLDEPAHFILLPQTAIWWIAPISAAIDLTWEATLDLWALIGDKDEVALYSYWTTAKAGFDSTRVLRIMAVVLLLPMLVFTALAIPWHVAIARR
jgi:hypothetical protein